ncbi:MAG: UDP-glucose 4-epimerase GalE [Pseudomonadota bacterium]
MSQSSILVTGGAGYIGSHMCRILRQAGHNVIVFDNLFRGHADAVVDAELFVGDLCNADDLKRCFASHAIDAVMHFAALAYVGESMREAGRYYHNNVVGSANLLIAMHNAGINKFVFSSTCAIYGEPQELPLTETHRQQPANPYGRTKMMVEGMLGDFHLAHNLQSISLRYFNAAGCDPSGELGERHSPETHLIPLVLLEALRIRDGGNPADTTLRVFGGDFPTADGTCIRDYVHVNDLGQAHSLALDRLLAGKVAGAEAYNLGNGTGFSVLDVISACRTITGLPIGYQIIERRPGDPSCLVGSSTRAREVLGWQPQHHSLDDMIGTAWRWFSQHG